MSSRTITVTLQFEARDMTQEEFDEAMEGACMDEDDEDTGPEGAVDALDGYQVSEVLAGALDTESYPEMLAGSGLFVHFGNAKVIAIDLSRSGLMADPEKAS